MFTGPLSFPYTASSVMSQISLVTGDTTLPASGLVFFFPSSFALLAFQLKEWKKDQKSAPVPLK